MAALGGYGPRASELMAQVRTHSASMLVPRRDKPLNCDAAECMLLAVAPQSDRQNRWTLSVLCMQAGAVPGQASSMFRTAPSPPLDYWQENTAPLEEGGLVERSILEETSTELMRACQRCMALEEDLEASEDRVAELEQLLDAKDTQLVENSTQVAQLRGNLQGHAATIQQLQMERQEVRHQPYRATESGTAAQSGCALIWYARANCQPR